MTRLHGKSIVNILGGLIILNGVFISLSLPFAIYYNEENWKTTAASAALGFIIGGLAFAFTKKGREPIK